MNFKLTIVMMFLVAFIILGAIWAYRAEKAVPAPTATKLFPADMEDIVAIRLLHGADTQIALVKQDDKWMLAPPISAPANMQAGSIASSLKDLSYSSKFTPEASGFKGLANIGLDNPRFTIEITPKKGVKRTLLLGKHTSANEVYARVDGDPDKQVYVLTTNPLDQLDKEPDDFRSMDIASIDPDQVQRLVIEHPKQTIELERTDKGWAIVKPVSLRADSAAVSTLLDSLHFLKAEKVAPLPATAAATGLTPGKVRITAYVKDAAPFAEPWKAATMPATAGSQPGTHPVTVVFGEYSDLTKKLVYAFAPGTTDAMLVSADILTKVDKDISGLRDPVVLPIDVSAATGATVFSSPLKGTPPVAVVELTKTGEDKWQEKTPEGLSFPADFNAVDTLLRSLKALRANKFVEAGDLKSIGLDPPAKRITMKVEGHEEELLIGEPQTAEPLTPVMRKGDDTVYLVQSPELVSLSNATPVSLRDKTVLRITADSINTIAIAGPAAKFPTTLIHSNNKWLFEGAASQPASMPATGPATTPATMAATATSPSTATAPAQPAPAMDQVLDLLSDVAALSAQKWIGPAGMPATTPDAVLTINYTMPADAPTSQPATTGPAKPETAGPMLPKVTIYTVQLYKKENDKKETEWTAYLLSSDGKPDWAFVPVSSLVDHLTATDYHISKPAPPPAPPGMMGGPGGGMGGMPPGINFGGQ